MNALNSTRERRHGSPAGAITRQLIAEMKELRDLDPATGAREVLAHHPEWAGHKQLLRDLACEEFSQRLAAGEALNAEEFGARFPGCGDSLLEILVTRQFFDENPEFLEDDEGQSWPEAGDMLLGFALIRELGRGAFARVFLAREPALGDRLVVVKVSLLDGSVEADTLGSLAHPNIVPVHSLCADDDTGWTVVCMPYHGSATLEDVLAHLARQPRLPERADVFLEVAEAVDGGWWMVDGAEAHGPRPVGLHPSSPSTEEEPAAILRGGSYLEGVLHLGSQMADALAHVHERRIYHRDLKPANVLLTPAGQPMLLDFNLSCNEEVGEQALGGTLPYMAPEQIQAMSERDARDQDAIGPRADLFALGVLLYELLTGKHPFGPLPRKNDRKALAAYLLDRQRSGPTPLRQLNPRVDRGIARLVEGCLAFDPEQRPASARLLAETLRGRLSAGQRLKRRVASHPWLLAAVAAGVLLVAGLFAALQLTPQARNARDLQAARQAYARGDNTGALQCFTQIIERGGESAAVRF
ncbi:MAG TPA: serine/threonine-protein kinase, partial [Gemmataceae bacterium]|nr:serine/threonine-protein kinase [Gemmataceae bacterium]